MSLSEQIHSLPQQTAGKVSVALASSGTALDFFNDYVGWVDVFLKYGNAVLLGGGLWLMFHKIVFKSKRRNRREEDQGD